jgi:hypothetical protein
MRVEPLPIQEGHRPHWARVCGMPDINIIVQGEGCPTICLIQGKQDATIEQPGVAAIVQGAYHGRGGC